jgi:histidinol-phosphatase (PHP family)
MVDLHVHCDYSVDAQGSADEYARHALARGLTHICFTTHCDLDPDRRHHDGRVRLRGEIVDVTSDWLGAYFADVKRAASRYAERGLKIFCGLEIGFVPGIERMIEDAISSNPFDFIMGGVHTLNGADIVSTSESVAYFKTMSPRQLCSEYFEVLEQAIECQLFDCIAHFDIYKRCGLDFYGEALNASHSGLFERSLDMMASIGLSLEVNSAGLRKNLPWPYPSPDILEFAKDAGIVDITIGSDCHLPEDIGRGLDRCVETALRSGFESLVVYEGRVRTEIALEELNVKDR